MRPHDSPIPALRPQYDLDTSTFSPDGRIFQTEYAQKAVDSSGWAPRRRRGRGRPAGAQARAQAGRGMWEGTELPARWHCYVRAAA